MRDGQAQTEKTILAAIRATQNDFREQILILSKRLNDPKRPGPQAIVAGWQAHNQPGVDTVLKTLTQNTEDAQRKASVQMYLDSLYFSQIEERRSQIPDAHQKTFKWVFDECPTDLRWRDFATWFRSKDPRDSLYWITGKPGSGKSTLMRYLWGDQRTEEHLQVWAGSRELLTADCFFWNPGTKLQKSQSGLLRSLLHGLLRQYPSLIPVVSPWRWRSYDFGAINMDPWSDVELKAALHEFMRAAEAESICICLFVDGLDEFEGSEENRSEIVVLLQQISRHDYVKVCLSSRPWRIFEDAFEGDPKLLLQDLTREDISLYVNDMLEQNTHFQRFKSTDPETSSKLQTEVAKKSQGVFLWVFLVVRSLLQGFRNRDHIHVLMKRLEEIPSDLDAFFKQMLTQIEEMYRPQAAAIFQVAMDAPENLPLMMLSFLDEDNPNFGLDMPIAAVPESEIQAQLDDTAVRLKVRCKDFLEVYKLPEHGLFTTHNVDFLHRTVRDFLHTSEVQIILTRFSRKKGIDVNNYLANAMLAQMKGLRLQCLLSATASSMDDYMEISQRLLTYLDCRLPNAKQPMRQELETIMKAHKVTYGSIEGITTPRHAWMRESMAENAFLACAAAWGMRDYVVWAVGNQLPKMDQPLLSYAISPVSYTVTSDVNESPFVLDPELVKLLLELGADPNEKRWGPTSHTVWKYYLESLEEVSHKTDLIPAKSIQHYIQISEHMIRHGAARQFDGFNEVAGDYFRKSFGSKEAIRLDDLWWRQNLTGRPLMKKLVYSFSRRLSGKNQSGNPSQVPPGKAL